MLSDLSTSLEAFGPSPRRSVSSSSAVRIESLQLQAPKGHLKEAVVCYQAVCQVGFILFELLHGVFRGYYKRLSTGSQRYNDLSVCGREWKQVSLPHRLSG